MATRQNRRSFMSIVTSLAGMAALGPNRTADAQTAATSKWDLAWVDDLKGKHMQVYDMLDADPSSAPSPLRLPRNYMDAFRDVMQMEFPDVRTVVGIAGGPAFAINASDRLWEKYALGERSKITDPATGKTCDPEHSPGRWAASASRRCRRAAPSSGMVQCRARRYRASAGGCAQAPGGRRPRGPGGRSRSRCAPRAVARDGAGAGPGTWLHVHEALKARPLQQADHGDADHHREIAAPPIARRAAALVHRLKTD